MSAIVVGIQAQVGSNASTQAERDVFLAENSIMVIGSSIDLSERSALEFTKASNEWLAMVRGADDSDATLAAIDSGAYRLVILIGGPEQNNITKALWARGWFNETYDVEGEFIVQRGSDGRGGVVLSISDREGYVKGLRHESAEHSPLSAFMPKEYVPAAATGISLLLLALINVGRTVFEFKALDIGRKGKKVGEGASFWRGMNLTEMGAILGASAVLGLSISWQFFGGDFLGWLVINTLVCLGAAILHEITHRVFAHYFRIKMEYRFWPAGSLLTLISSYLGNAFSIQGFILEEIPPDTPKWKAGVMKLSAPLVSAAVMVVFALMYASTFEPLYKIIYSTSALWAMAEILPFGSLDGKDIKEWSHTVWFLAFTLIGISYFVVTFLI